MALNYTDNTSLVDSLEGIQPVTWINDLTRLNASNMNQMSQHIKTLAEVLYSKENSSKGVIQQVDKLRWTIQGATDDIPVSLRSHHSQLSNINQALFGRRKNTPNAYQLQDYTSDVESTLKQYLGISQERNPLSLNDVNTYSGIIDRVYWEYNNYHKPVIEHLGRHRSIFRDGYKIEDSGLGIWDAYSPGLEDIYGIFPIAEVVDKELTFHFNWKDAGSIRLQDAIDINTDGHIIPINDGSVDLGSSDKTFKSAYVTNLNFYNLHGYDATIQNSLKLYKQGTSSSDVVTVGTASTVNLGNNTTLHGAVAQLMGSETDQLSLENKTGRTIHAVANKVHSLDAELSDTVKAVQDITDSFNSMILFIDGGTAVDAINGFTTQT